MECNDKNKRKFQCGRKESSACVEYAGWLPKWSELNLEDCVTVEEVLEEQYKVLDKILTSIDVSSLGRGCVDYPSSTNRTVAMVLAAFEDLICGNNGRRVEVFASERYTVSKTKMDVPSGFKGTEVEYEVPEGRYVSSVSQSDANSLAIADATNNAQEYANRFGSYKAVIYYNEAVSKDIAKNDCPENRPCGTVTYTVRAGKYSSTTSQAEADALAQEDIEKNGQAFANANGKCKPVYYSKYISKTFYKNDCPSGEGDPEGFLYELPNGAIISEISQHDADTQALEKAMKEGQEQANISGTCSTIYYNKEMSKAFRRDDCEEGQRGKDKIYKVKAGVFESFVSEAEADKEAAKYLNEYGKEMVKAEGECTDQYWSIKSYVYPSGTAVVFHEPSAKEGEVESFSITEMEDFKIDHVLVNGKESSVNDKYGTFLVEGPTIIKVYMRAKSTYNVEVEATPSDGGFVNILTGDKQYKAGENCIIEAAPAAGASFEGWVKDGVLISLSKTYSFIVGRNTSGKYIAVFNKG